MRMNVSELLPTVWTPFQSVDCSQDTGSTAISNLTLDMEKCKETCATTQDCTAVVHQVSTDSCNLMKEVVFQTCARGRDGMGWNTHVIGEGETISPTLL